MRLSILPVFLLATASYGQLSDCPISLLSHLNKEYLARHALKEESYWGAQMGSGRHVPGSFELTEETLNTWAADTTWRKHIARALKSSSVSPVVRQGLEQWDRFFEVRAQPDLPRWIASLAGRVGRRTTSELYRELLETEARLTKTKKEKVFYLRKTGQPPVPKTLTELRLLVANDPDESTRQGALEALQELERFGVENGLIPVIKMRNRLAKRLGFKNYYEWRVQTNEGMNVQELFAILDDLERRTRDAGKRAVDHFVSVHGDSVRKPWNFSYLTQGQTTALLEPYFPFSNVLFQFGRSFHRMGVSFRGASLVMDLVERPEKYPNGFIRALVPAHTQVAVGEDGPQTRFIPAKTQFSSNAVPGQVGSGYSTTHTVLHEAGHHACFANIETPSVAGSQEESPSSIAAAETQSMFFDALQSDPAWLARYARNEDGQAVPWDLVQRRMEEMHWLRASGLRSMLAVPYMERALYEMPEDELQPDRLIEIARDIERRLLFTEASGRPVLSIPHIYSLESSAYYHGYVLAELAVYMTRDYFFNKYGTITDNPQVGPELAEAYWKPGNSIPFGEMIRRLTGKPFSADAAVKVVNTPLDAFLAEQQFRFLESANQAWSLEPLTSIELDGDFTVMHGDVQIATTLGGKDFMEMARDFHVWIRRLELSKEAPSSAGP